MNSQIDGLFWRRLAFQKSLLREDPLYQAHLLTFGEFHEAFEETKSPRRDHQRGTVGHSCSATSRVRACVCHAYGRVIMTV